MLHRSASDTYLQVLRDEGESTTLRSVHQVKYLRQKAINAGEVKELLGTPRKSQNMATQVQAVANTIQERMVQVSLVHKVINFK